MVEEEREGLGSVCLKRWLLKNRVVKKGKKVFMEEVRKEGVD